VNVDDMIQKGRMAVGEARKHVLREADVIDIRTLAAFGARRAALAAEFEISVEHVRDLINHKRWRHIP